MSLNTFDEIKQRLQNESSILRNMSNVINKLTSDNNILPTFFTNILEIFKNEMVFTFSVLNKISDTEENFDMKEQFMNNIYIFKENFKILSSIIVEDVWKNFVTETEYEKVRSNNLSFASLIENNLIDPRNLNNPFYNNSNYDGILKPAAVQPPQTIEEVDDEEDTHSNVTSTKSENANLIVYVQGNEHQESMGNKNNSLSQLENIEINLSVEKLELEQQTLPKEVISQENSLYQSEKSIANSKYGSNSPKESERTSHASSEKKLDKQYSLSTDMLKKVQDIQRDSVKSNRNSVQNISTNNEAPTIKRDSSLNNLYNFEDSKQIKKDDNKKKGNFFDSKNTYVDCPKPNLEKNHIQSKNKKEIQIESNVKSKTENNSLAHSKKKSKNQRKSNQEVLPSNNTNESQKIDIVEKKANINQLEQEFNKAKQETEANCKNLSHNYLNLNFPSTGNGSSQNISITINNATNSSAQNIAPFYKTTEQTNKRSKSTKMKKTGSLRDCYKDTNAEVINQHKDDKNVLRGKELEITKEGYNSLKNEQKREGNKTGYSNYTDRKYRKNVGYNSNTGPIPDKPANTVTPTTTTPTINQNIITTPETLPTNNLQISTNNTSNLNSQIHPNSTCNAYSNINTNPSQNNSVSNLKNEASLNIKTPENSRSFCMKQGNSKDKILNNNNKKHYLYSDESDKNFIGNNREAVVSSSYMRILKTLERSKYETREMEPEKIVPNITIKKKERSEHRTNSTKAPRSNYGKTSKN